MFAGDVWVLMVGVGIAVGGCQARTSVPAVDAATLDAGAPPDIGPCSALDASYTVCGCGCCPGVPSSMRCLDRAHGETLERVELLDHMAAGDPGCANSGCSAPVVVVCCD